MISILHSHILPHCLTLIFLFSNQTDFSTSIFHFLKTERTSDFYFIQNSQTFLLWSSVKVTTYLDPPLEFIGAGPPTSMCARSKFCCLGSIPDLENFTDLCLPNIQLSHNCKLKEFSLGNLPVLCSTFNPFSLRCPILLCVERNLQNLFGQTWNLSFYFIRVHIPRGVVI